MCKVVFGYSTPPPLLSLDFLNFPSGLLEYFLNMLSVLSIAAYEARAFLSIVSLRFSYRFAFYYYAYLGDYND